jgi:hypothetical protein
VKRFLRVLALAAAAFAAAWSPGAAQTAGADPSNLLKRMALVNAKLQSYSAKTHVDIALRTFPFIAPSLDGSYYYKQPDKQAIVFDTVPVIAQQFQKVYPKFDPPSKWPAIYEISVLGSDSATTTLRLVPRQHGRVTHLDVKVDNASATPTEFTWTYGDGGFVTFGEQYAQVDGNYLVKSQTGKVELPSYKADVTSTFTNFKLNVQIPDTVFAS